MDCLYKKGAFQEIRINGKDIASSVYSLFKMAVKWRDLAWPRKSSKFNLHHLRKIFMGYKMAM